MLQQKTTLEREPIDLEMSAEMQASLERAQANSVSDQVLVFLGMAGVMTMIKEVKVRGD